jgi:hypothetical protein
MPLFTPQNTLLSFTPVYDSLQKMIILKLKQQELGELPSLSTQAHHIVAIHPMLIKKCSLSLTSRDDT